jgi:hypothetical protein
MLGARVAKPKPADGAEKPPMPKSYYQRLREWVSENITKPGRAMSAKDFSRSVR